MVSTSEKAGWARRVWEGVCQRTTEVLSALTPPAAPRPGLYTYRFSPNGGQHRIHLRIEQDGSGVLFIDVNDVIHLNATAAEMAKMALDGITPDRARAGVLHHFRNASRAQVSHDLAHIYEMIESLTCLSGGCPTCTLGSTLERTPLFSTPVCAPYKVDLALTYGCNNLCSHCYNETERRSMKPLATADWCRVIDHLATIGVPHLILTGGEATLRSDLPTLIAHADRSGMIVGLNTNGRRLADPAFAGKLVAAGLNHVQITLGSCRAAVHDAMVGASEAFHQTVRGIQNAVDSSLHTITNTTLMRSNMGHIEEIIAFLHNMGIQTFALNGVIASGGGVNSPEAIPHEELSPLLARVRDYAGYLGMRFLWYTPTEYCRLSPIELEIGAKRCNAGEYTMCIEPDGTVLPCQSYYVSAGNILRDPWEKIWNSELFRRFRNRSHDPQGSGLPEQCWGCPELLLCGGGCPLERQDQEAPAATCAARKGAAAFS